MAHPWGFIVVVILDGSLSYSLRSLNLFELDKRFWNYSVDLVL